MAAEMSIFSYDPLFAFPSSGLDWEGDCSYLVLRKSMKSSSEVRERMYLRTLLVLLVTSAQLSAQWTVETVDAMGLVGYNPSLEIDSQDQPCIAYERHGTGAKYARHSGGQWQIEVCYPYTISNIWFVSLALDQDDSPHISLSHGWLMYAFLDDSLEWDDQTVHYSSSTAGSSIECAATDEQFISYCLSVYDSRLALASNASGSWEIDSLVDPDNSISMLTSLCLNDEGYPYIAYARDNPTMVMLAESQGQASWDLSVVDTLDQECLSVSLVLDDDNRPHIAYNAEEGPRYCYRSGDEWQTEVVDACDSGSWIYGVSIALDQWDNPHVAYCTSDGSWLRYASRSDSGWVSEDVFSFHPPYFIAGDPDLEIDSSGRPHIAFFSGSMMGSDLMYAVGTETGIEREGGRSETGMDLSGPYPNPCGGASGVSLYLRQGAEVDIDIFDMAGRLVGEADPGWLGAGLHEVSLQLPGEGIYLVRLTSGGITEVCRVVSVQR